MTSLDTQPDDLSTRIAERTATVGIVGLGYVGLPLSLGVYDTGFDVIGVDINGARVEAINSGTQVLNYLAPDRISNARDSGRYRATTNARNLSEADVVLVSVPTSITDDDRPDISILLNAVTGIAPFVRSGALVIIESTVYPGAMQAEIGPVFEQAGHRIGETLYLAFSPEREDPGNHEFNTRNIPKLVGADDPASRELAVLFYKQVVENVVEVSSTAVAETVKVYENSFRTVNIALANEMKPVCRALGIDVNEMIAAAATKPFGFMPFYPGPGIGGDCIPVSPVLLNARVEEIGATLPMVDLAIRSMREIPAGVVARAAEAAGGSLAGKRVLLLGISYKKDVGDVRRSPALDIVRLVEEAGGTCDYHDPLVASIRMGDADRASVDLTEDRLRETDLVIIATDHTDVDYAMVARRDIPVVDTRNVMKTLGIGTMGPLVQA